MFLKIIFCLIFSFCYVNCSYSEDLIHGHFQKQFEIPANGSVTEVEGILNGPFESIEGFRYVMDSCSIHGYCYYNKQTDFIYCSATYLTCPFKNELVGVFSGVFVNKDNTPGFLPTKYGDKIFLSPIIYFNIKSNL